MGNKSTVIEEMIEHIEEHGFCVIKNQTLFITGYNIWKKLETFYKLTNQDLNYTMISISKEHGISVRIIYKPSHLKLLDTLSLLHRTTTLKKLAIDHSFIFVLDYLFDKEDDIHERCIS